MQRFAGIAALAVFILVMLPWNAGAVIEPKTKTEYPDEVVLGDEAQQVILKATGTALREKTFMKVDVYTIVSYVQTDADLAGDDSGLALIDVKAPKRLQMDLRRGFSREKLINAFTGGIDKNFEDQSAFAADIEIFKAYFDRDAEDGDQIIFHYCPAKGLTTTLNGKDCGLIENFEFVRALWTVWFGKKPANDGMKKALLSQLGS